MHQYNAKNTPTRGGTTAWEKAKTVRKERFTGQNESMQSREQLQAMKGWRPTTGTYKEGCRYSFEAGSHTPRTRRSKIFISKQPDPGTQVPTRKCKRRSKNTSNTNRRSKTDLVVQKIKRTSVVKNIGGTNRINNRQSPMTAKCYKWNRIYSVASSRCRAEL